MAATDSARGKNGSAATDSYAGGDGRLSPLSTPSATRAVLEAHGIGAKYTLGQNFLVNDDVLKKIVALAEVGENDRVLEVGPGIGTLTIALLKHAASVIAIERDPDLPAVLADTLHPWREKFALIEKDALDVTEGDIISAASTMGERGGISGGAHQASSAAKFTSTMVEPGGDTGCPDRASSAANETAQWARARLFETNPEPQPRPRKKNTTGLPDKWSPAFPYAVAATVVLDYFEKLPLPGLCHRHGAEGGGRPHDGRVGARRTTAPTHGEARPVRQPASRFAVGQNFFRAPRSTPPSFA